MMKLDSIMLQWFITQLANKSNDLVGIKGLLFAAFASLTENTELHVALHLLDTLCEKIMNSSTYGFVVEQFLSTMILTSFKDNSKETFSLFLSRYAAYLNDDFIFGLLKDVETNSQANMVFILFKTFPGFVPYFYNDILSLIITFANEELGHFLKVDFTANYSLPKLAAFFDRVTLENKKVIIDYLAALKNFQFFDYPAMMKTVMLNLKNLGYEYVEKIGFDKIAKFLGFKEKNKKKYCVMMVNFLLDYGKQNLALELRNDTCSDYVPALERLNGDNDEINQLHKRAKTSKFHSPSQKHGFSQEELAKYCPFLVNYDPNYLYECLKMDALSYINNIDFKAVAKSPSFDDILAKLSLLQLKNRRVAAIIERLNPFLNESHTLAVCKFFQQSYIQRNYLTSEQRLDINEDIFLSKILKYLPGNCVTSETTDRFTRLIDKMTLAVHSGNHQLIKSVFETISESTIKAILLSLIPVIDKDEFAVDLFLDMHKNMSVEPKESLITIGCIKNEKLIRFLISKLPNQTSFAVLKSFFGNDMKNYMKYFDVTFLSFKSIEEVAYFLRYFLIETVEVERNGDFLDYLKILALHLNANQHLWPQNFYIRELNEYKISLYLKGFNTSQAEISTWPKESIFNFLYLIIRDRCSKEATEKCNTAIKFYLPLFPGIQHEFIELVYILDIELYRKLQKAINLPVSLQYKISTIFLSKNYESVFIEAPENASLVVRALLVIDERSILEKYSYLINSSFLKEYWGNFLLTSLLAKGFNYINWQNPENFIYHHYQNTILALQKEDENYLRALLQKSNAVDYLFYGKHMFTFMNILTNSNFPEINARLWSALFSSSYIDKTELENRFQSFISFIRPKNGVSDFLVTNLLAYSIYSKNQLIQKLLFQLLFDGTGLSIKRNIFLDALLYQATKENQQNLELLPESSIMFYSSVLNDIYGFSPEKLLLDPTCSKATALRFTHMKGNFLSSGQYIDEKIEILYGTSKFDYKDSVRVLVRRNDLLNSSLWELLNNSLLFYKRPKIEFVSEFSEAVDFNGVTRDWLYTVSKEFIAKCFIALHDGHYFVDMSKKLSEGYERYLLAFGRLMGIALKTRNQIYAPLPLPSIKFFLDRSLEFGDIQLIYPVLDKFLRSEEVPSFMDFTYSLDNRTFDLFEDLDEEMLKQVKFENEDYHNYFIEEFKNLKKSGHKGAEIEVTSTNVTLYKNLIAVHFLSIFTAYHFPIFRGLQEVVGSTYLGLFSEAEFYLLINGNPEIDLADWKRNTSYAGGLTADSNLVKWFWEILDESSFETHQKVLKFVHGSPISPINGFENLTGNNGPCIFNIILNVHANLDFLPRAQTCFNSLYLPNYATKEDLKNKLLIAIEETSITEA